MPSGHKTGVVPSRFHPLLDRLAACEEDELVLTFTEVAALIGRRTLPETAILHRAWWTSKGNGHVAAWRMLGWQAHPDRDNLRVRFTRDARNDVPR